MVATLEAIFRRPLRLLFFILLLPVLSMVVVYLLPRSYQATSSLWGLRRYIVIGATGPETDLQATPAQTQATALTELLKSRTFALTIANETKLPSTLSASVRADPQTRDNDLYQEISTNVQVTPSGYNLFEITYTNQNPTIAQQVVAATIHNFDLQSQSFTAVEAQQLLTSYQGLLAKAKQQQDAAAQTESQYIQNNPDESVQDLQIDPQFQLLHAQTLQAEASVQNIENAIDTINQEIAQQGTGSANLFKVLDASAKNVHEVSRVKDYLVGGGVALGLALLACTLYIVISVRRNRVIYTPLGLEKVTPFPVVMELPRLSAATKSLLTLPEPVDAVHEAVGARR